MSKELSPEDQQKTSEWLKTVTDERYDVAAELERLLRYSVGGTNHKRLIDEFIQKNYDRMKPKIKIEVGGELTGDGKIEKQERRKIEDDPNYEKYCAEIEAESQIKRTDEGFEMLFLLHKHLEETPQEELEKEWAEIDAMKIEGPTVDEYFESLNPMFQYQKGYTKGAETLIQKMKDRLQGEERPTIPVTEVVAMMNDIFENE